MGEECARRIGCFGFLSPWWLHLQNKAGRFPSIKFDVLGAVLERAACGWARQQCGEGAKDAPSQSLVCASVVTLYDNDRGERTTMYRTHMLGSVPLHVFGVSVLLMIVSSLLQSSPASHQSTIG